MKLSKFFAMAAIAAMTISLGACSDDDKPVPEPTPTPAPEPEPEPTPEPEQSAWDKKMNAVTAEVTANKSKSSALLLISFGSTWEEPQKTFQKVKNEFKEAFPDRDVYFAFTSEIIMNRVAANDELISKGYGPYYSPLFYMLALGKAGYTQIDVQSLHVIPGEEFLRVQSVVKDFHNTDQDGDGKREFEGVKVALGTPLLYTQEDVDNVAKILHEKVGKDFVAAGDVVAFMGHGNPEDYNTMDGNTRYTMMEEALQKIDPHYFVATVDMEDNYIDEMIERMQAKGYGEGTKVKLHPLMSIAGDHVNNDMAAGPEEEPEEDDGFWRYRLVEAGYDCTLEDCILQGLGEYPDIVNIWIQHTKAAQEDLFYDGETED